MSLAVIADQACRSRAKSGQLLSMGCARSHSMLHRQTLTLGAGLIPLGAIRVYWYARVLTVMLGNAAATLFTKASRVPAGLP